jgi:hypothetical protein
VPVGVQVDGLLLGGAGGEPQRIVEPDGADTQNLLIPLIAITTGAWFALAAEAWIDEKLAKDRPPR